DDTNPDAEKEEYFVAIEETIRWLGFAPSKITYASGNFQHMYDLAEDLLKRRKPTYATATKPRPSCSVVARMDPLRDIDVRTQAKVLRPTSPSFAVCGMASMSRRQPGSA